MSNKKFDKKLNYDVATDEKIKETNEKLVGYMQGRGENTAVEQIEHLIENQVPKNKKPTVKNPINDKLLGINTEILGVLKDIRDDAFDEQDTSVKMLSAKQSNISFPVGDKNQSGEGGAGAGMGLGGLLAGFGLNKLRKLLNPKKTPKVDADNKKKIADNKKQIADNKKKISDNKKLATANKNAANKQAAEAKKKAAEAKKKASQTTKKPSTKTDTFNNKPLANQAKPPKVGGINHASNVPQTQVKSIKPQKVTSSGIARKLMKFTKVIPFLGTAITAGTAIYAAEDGYKRADEILGVPKKELTKVEKLAAAAGAVVNDFSFGMVDAKETAETILEYSQDKEKERIIKKYQDGLNVIDHDLITHSEIVDIDRISVLTPTEIQEIISLDDWSTPNMILLKKAKKYSEDYTEYKLREKEHFKTSNGEKFKEQAPVNTLHDKRITSARGNRSNPSPVPDTAMATNNVSGNVRTSAFGIKSSKSNVSAQLVEAPKQIQDEQEKPVQQRTSARSTKKAKELFSQQVTQNLTAQVKNYDNSTSVQGATALIQNSSINNNITSEKPSRQRLLNAFNK
jgi:hypothetical protein